MNGDFRRKDLCLFFIISIFFSSVYFLFASWDHHHGNSGIFDLGLFDQVFYAKITSGLWHSSILEQDIFRDHFSLVLWMLLPFYRMYPSADTLLFFQSLALGISCGMAYRMARHYFSQGESAVWAGLFGFLPSLLYISVWDFHPLVFVLPLLMMGLLFEMRLEIGKSLVFYAATLLIREEMGVILAVIGVIWFFQKAKRGYGILLMAMGLAGFLWVTHWMGSGFGKAGLIHLERYSHLGLGLSDIVRRLMTHPLKSLQASFSAKKLLTFAMLFLPYGAVSALGWPLVLNAMPGLIINFLSQVPNQFDFRAHYMVTIIPFIYGGALLGVAGVLKKGWNKIWVYRTLIVLMVLMQGVYVLIQPISSRRDFKGLVTSQSPAYMGSLPQVMSLVDPRQSLVVSNALGAQIARRSKIYLFGKRAYEKEQDNGLLIELAPSDPWPFQDQKQYCRELAVWCDSSLRHVEYRDKNLVLLLPGTDSGIQTGKLRNEIEELLDSG